MAIFVSGKRKELHRHIMEQHLGRKLGFNEVVHHINEDTRDNRIENLQLMTRAEHQRLHIAQRTQKAHGVGPRLPLRSGPG